jgi:RimJ/RimL family protein N-acetyltransferase
MMSTQPTLITGRLALRPFTLADAPEVQRLAGEWAIADTTLNIPHPYEDGMAATWIGSHVPTYRAGHSVTFAITLRSSGALVGAIGLTKNNVYRRGEIGYWIGKPFWGQGYCTEAARAVLDFGFGPWELNRIHAYHFVRNPASGRVMAKIGMQYEGLLRQHVLKWGRFEDLALYGILRSDPR